MRRGSGLMRKKELKIVVTFHTTADAMAMEKVCKERGVPGRLIPVPRAISAGCGLSWCAELTDREQILDVMKALANQISGRIEVDSSNITQVDKKTVKVHSELPLYSLSVLSQESDAKVLSAKAENELDVERNISLNATDLKNGIKIEKMF